MTTNTELAPCLSKELEEAPRTLASVWGLAYLVIPFLGTIAAWILAALWGIAPEVHFIAILMSVVTGFGVTVGYHRYFVHRSFDTSRPVAWILAIAGSMSGQAFMVWVSDHRKHHRHSDKDGDPHSPRLGGFWHAHMKWLLGRRYVADPKDIRDLLKRPDLVWIDRFGFLWYLLGLILPGVFCGLISDSLAGALMGFLFGGLYRQFFVQHATYLVNSATHLWGTKDYPTEDDSRNNLFLSVLTLGESWHNNHHAFPYSARHGLYWWQIDPTWYVIWMMAKLGLVWNIRLPKSTLVRTTEGTSRA